MKFKIKFLFVYNLKNLLNNSNFLCKNYNK